MPKAKVIAFYLPQFHPTPENDEWWGKGFTEWTNVAKAKPLYRGHYQPKIPADLGFYDLRLSDSRELQADYARMAGIEAFCYWHYWFGNGRKLLNIPFEQVVESGKPDFPFCLAWANHSWYNKSWTSKKGSFSLSESKLLIEQLYPGEQDIIDHFNYLLPAFKDNRYYRLHGRPLFVIYNPWRFDGFVLFKDTWNLLAQKNGLPPFFFVAHVFEQFDKISSFIDIGYDAVNVSLHHAPFSDDISMKRKKGLSLLRAWVNSHYRNKPVVVEYKDAILKMDSEIYNEPYVFPTIIPNWDHTPRSGNFGKVFQNCEPVLFRKHAEMVFDRVQSRPDVDDRIVFLKSWNEWGEGNYMEPDLKYGNGYIMALKDALNG